MTDDRWELRALAEEQSALLRVAELVARAGPPQEVFAAVAAEAAKLFNGEAMTLTRFDGDRELLVEATHRGPAPVGTRIAFQVDTLPDWVQLGVVVRVDDYTTQRDAELAKEFGLAAAVSAPISVAGEVWGMLTATSGEQPLPVGAEHRLAQFAKLVAAALANSHARVQLQTLADEQAALRRVAELAAREATAEGVLDAVTVQASGLTGVDFTTLLRYEPDGSTEIVAVDGAPEGVVVGMRAPGTGDGAVQRVWRTGHAARIDNLAQMSGHWPKVAHGFGFSTSAAVPIVIQGGLWGALVAVGRREPLPKTSEKHLTSFAELVGIAISAAQARKELRVLADEQAALRRVAELVARGAAVDEVFAAVATEASKLLGDVATALLRYDGDRVAVAVAVCNSPTPLGLRIPFQAEMARMLGVGAGVAVPVTVEGHVWGTLTTSTPGVPLPFDTEHRLGQFAELAAAAIANAENKRNLTASRARVVATADETRRRLQRDVHDGAQQRLVHTIIALKLARDAIANGGTAAELIDEALNNAERANTELRDVVRGVLPASLTRGGLRAGIDSLIADLVLPVDLDVSVPRLPAAMETTAYFIVAEALTNVVKHAQASRADIQIRLDDKSLAIDVRDDGMGGADPSRGTGLTGLRDRVDASEGALTLTSPARGGTILHATLPVRP